MVETEGSSTRCGRGGFIASGGEKVASKSYAAASSMLMAVEPNKQSGPAGERRPYVATFVLYDAHKASMPLGMFRAMHIEAKAKKLSPQMYMMKLRHNIFLSRSSDRLWKPLFFFEYCQQLLSDTE